MGKLNVKIGKKKFEANTPEEKFHPGGEL